MENGSFNYKMSPYMANVTIKMSLQMENEIYNVSDM